ncbi:MalY/PatB family protein [Marinobacterium sediminicola]|uniref:cysteine-S-conjugate beta-lyase n=1 Tax=Marinobacterium sediminicola TaxID=518898 RepID=A0ABY1S0M3_9GAMM|nr:PatB family C-S lyase [Marinobacterium sediminicola]ULG69660.1 PatB family C-S lyase [Marinobacterium sediminicola]SMR74612.1 cystathione beta-lyase [Marinobacterium sediminicola]
MNATRFDQLIDRRATSSEKWEKYADSEILPMWVADTDFMAPQPVIEALHQRIDHGVFGYTCTPQELNQLVIERMQSRYDWQIEANDLVWLPGLVCGLNLACRAVGESGSAVITPAPVYPPFMSAPRLSERTLIKVPLKRGEDCRTLIDLEALEAAITPEAKLLLFCNPHNPGGTLYRREELSALAEIIIRHDLIICSDEIHCDLILEPGLTHTPIASLGEEIAARTITLMAPSKTYNIAGLGCSFAVIQNPELRQRFQRVRKGIVPDVNLLGYTATLAAYRDGDEWNRAQLNYLRANRDYLVEAINAIPGLKLDPIEATYLAWIDVSAASLENPPHFFEQAGVGMSPGRDFGDDRFMRLNFGCPRALLEQAVDRIRRALLNELPA